MQKWDDLEEIEALGEEEEDGAAWEDGGPRAAESGGLSTAPLLQALVCVLLLAGLLYLRHSGRPEYERIRERYRQEAEQEWRMPSWEGGLFRSPEPSASPEPSPSPTPAPAGLPGVEVQRL